MTSAARKNALLQTAPRRGLCRDEAAIFVGVSATKFDSMVEDGRMPKPVKVDARWIYDLRALDLAFDRLSDQGESRDDDAKWDNVAA